MSMKLCSLNCHFTSVVYPDVSIPRQTNVMNNNNKYYLIQLLEDNQAKKYYVWQRWGRGSDSNI